MELCRVVVPDFVGATQGGGTWTSLSAVSVAVVAAAACFFLISPLGHAGWPAPSHFFCRSVTAHACGSVQLDSASSAFGVGSAPAAFAAAAALLLVACRCCLCFLEFWQPVGCATIWYMLQGFRTEGRSGTHAFALAAAATAGAVPAAA